MNKQTHRPMNRSKENQPRETKIVVLLEHNPKNKNTENQDLTEKLKRMKQIPWVESEKEHEG